MSTLTLPTPRFASQTSVLDRNHPAIKGATPVMSKAAKAPVMAMELPQDGFTTTSWGDTVKTPSGGYAVLYGFSLVEDKDGQKTGEVKADINLVDRATFLATYSNTQGGATYQQQGKTPEAGVNFLPFKTRAPHGIHIPQAGQTQIQSKEGLQDVKPGMAIIVDGTGDPYTNKAARAASNFEPVTERDVDVNNKPYNAKDIAASQAIFPAIKNHFNLIA